MEGLLLNIALGTRDTETSFLSSKEGGGNMQSEYRVLSPIEPPFV